MAARKGGLQDAKGGDVLAMMQASFDARKTKASMPQEREDLADAMKRRARKNLSPAQRVKIAPQQRPQAKKGKERIRMSAGAKAEALASVEMQVVAPAPPPSLALYDFGERDFQRIAKLRERLDAFVASHGAPKHVSATTAVTIERRIAAGACMAVDRDDGFFLGLDFGTSTTKAVFRHPYKRLAFAVPVPGDFATDGLPHIWPTAVFLDPADGSLGLCPADGRIALTGFKSALIERKAQRICNASGVTMLEAATAFFALYIAQALGSLAERDPAASVAGLHLAVPVAALAENAGKLAFDRVMQIALRLLPEAERLTIDHVRIAASLNEKPAYPYELHTELTGAIAGYCTQPRRYQGAHLIVDCGSATLDIASFQLGAGPWPIGIHSAQVEPLGSDACALYRRHGASAPECRGAARFQEHLVFSGAYQRDPQGFGQAGDRLFPYQMILVGGGMAGTIHAELFNGMEDKFQRAFQRPDIARDLECDPATDATRLIIADGLARDPIDLREIIMPGDRPITAQSKMPEMISKDQV